MNETSVRPIGSLQTPESSAPAKVIAPERAENTAAHEQTTPADSKSTRKVETEKARAAHLSNISIHFDVDQETNRLTVVVTERESGRVIRTIPASEFEKHQAGDLLKLKA